MTKQQFINELSAALHSMPREERYRTLQYYDELIDDKVEDGQPEEQAVADLGDPEQVAREILGQEETAEKPTKRSAWWIVLLVLGCPLWGSLLLALLAVLLSVYLCLFVPTLVLGVLAVGFLAAAILGVVGAPFLVFDVGLLTGGLPAGLFQTGMAVALLGLAILCGLAFWFTGKATVKSGKTLWRWLYRRFTRKGRTLA